MGGGRALAQLGLASPLAGAEVVWQAEPAAAASPRLAHRREKLAAAERKLSAARALIATEMGAEALALLRDALALSFRALDERGDPGDSPATLLAAVFGHLVPSGALSSAEGGALTRAGELARAFGESPVAPPAALVEEVAGEARDLLARVRERLETGAGAG